MQYLAMDMQHSDYVSINDYSVFLIIIFFTQIATKLLITALGVLLFVKK